MGVTNLQTAKDGLEAELAAAQERLEEEERKASMLGGDKKKQKAQIDDLTAKNAEATDKIAKLETEKSSQAKQIEALNAEVAARETPMENCPRTRRQLRRTWPAPPMPSRLLRTKARNLAKRRPPLRRN